MTDTQEMLGKAPIGKLLLNYSLPAIIGMMVNSLYNVVDRMFIANIPDVGPLAITGVGITMPIMTIILAFSGLVGIGGATNVSIKLGEGKREEAEQIVGNTLGLAVIVSIILTIIGIVFGNSILELFGASENSLPYAKAYINIILLGTVFNVLSMVLNNLIRGDGNPRLSATIMVVGCLTNIVLDAIFVFGINMGIQGAALATVISQIVSATIGVSYYLRGKSNLKFKLSELKLKSSLVKTIFAIGLAPFAVQVSASTVQIISNNALKTYGGDLAIGAMATIMSIMMLFLMPIFGIVQGAQPIVGFNYGAKQYDRAKKTFILSIIAATIILILGWFVIQFIPEIIISMFAKDEQLMKITIDGIRKYGLVLPIISISVMGSNYMQAIGKAKISMTLSLLRQVIILIPMIMILPKFLQLDGVWIAQPTADIVAVIVTSVVLIKEFKSYKNKEVKEEKKPKSNCEEVLHV